MGNNLKLMRYYAEKFRKITGIEVQSQHWGGKRKFSMEGISVEYFSNSVDRDSNETKI